MMLVPWIRWFPRDRGVDVVPVGAWLWTFISDSEGVFIRVVGLEIFWRRG